MQWTSCWRKARFILVMIIASQLSGCLDFNRDDNIVYQDSEILEQPVAAVNFSYYGAAKSLDDIQAQVPVHSGSSQRIKLQVAANLSGIGYHFSGYFHARQDDAFIFNLNANGVSQLEVNKALLIPGSTIYLAEGYHKIDFWSIPDNGEIQPRIIVNSHRSGELDIAAGRLYLPLDEVSTVQPQAAPDSSVAGFLYRYYESAAISLDKLAELLPVEEGNTLALNLSQRNSEQDSALVFKTFVNITQAGLYSFRSRLNGVFKWSISDRLLQTSLKTQTHEYLNSLWLTPGVYPMEFTLLNTPELELSKLEWGMQTPENLEPLAPINASGLFGREANVAVTYPDIPPISYYPINSLDLTAEKVLVEPITGVEPEAEAQAGINYRYYYSAIPQSIEHLDNNMPNFAGFSSGFSLPHEELVFPNASYFESNIKIETQGRYSFYLRHSSYISGFIGDNPIGQPSKVAEQAGLLYSQSQTTDDGWWVTTVFLPQGYYKLRLFYHAIAQNQQPEMRLAIPGQISQTLEHFNFITTPEQIATDLDGDKVSDDEDAFPADPNESADLDNDGIGDNSDPDRDGDGVNNEQDAFPNDKTEWLDSDADGIGDNSDPDRDGDGVNNEQDAFPDNKAEWQDSDGDGIGDNSDPDRDGDGVNNADDAFPNNKAEWLDSDADGIGDNSDPDRDGDGVNNGDDLFPSDPNEWADLDKDGIGDNQDPDIDGDGVLNSQDRFPLDPNEWADLDNDAIGDNSDPDRDGDGVNNEQDAYPDDPSRSKDETNEKDTDGDGYKDTVDLFPLDPTEWQDSDADGIGDNSDPDRDGDGVNNEQDAFPDNKTEWQDSDADGTGDNSDPDRDGDGVNNEQDAFPNDKTEWLDSDADGIGDNSDPDRDGDGVNNEQDAFPDNKTEWLDSDVDGIGDNSDPDRDGDGVNNEQDAFPDDKTEWLDSDADGIGDNSDPDRDGDGVNNSDDAYPDDPNRWSQTLSLSLEVKQELESVKLTWLQVDSPQLDSYRVLRSQNQGPFITITQVSKQTHEFIDTQVVENTLYDYKLEAIGRDEQIGVSPSRRIFVAFNNTQVKQFKLANAHKAIGISWLAIPHYSVIVERRTEKGLWQQLVESIEPTYSDSQVSHAQEYQYRAKTRRWFSHPSIEKSFFVDGPYTPVSLKTAIFPLRLTFTNADKLIGDDGVWYQHISQQASPVKISGRIDNAAGPVNLSFTSADKQVTTSINGTAFDIDLPLDELHTLWLAQASATFNSVPQQLEKPVSISFKADRKGAIIRLDNTSVTTPEAQIEITGSMIDDSGVASLTMTSHHFSGTQFGVMLKPDGRFSGEVPLVWGENIIELKAVDRLGNISHAQAIITRQSERQPSLKVVSHSDGQVVTEQELILTAEVISSLSLSEMKAWLNETQASLLDKGNDQFSVTFPPLTLHKGENLLIVRVESAAGVIQQMIKVDYQPELLITAPQIQILSPVIGAWVNTQNFEIKGLVQSQVRPSVSVNGHQLTAYLQDKGRYRFSYLAKKDEVSWSVEAENKAGVDSIALDYRVDIQPPVIQLMSQLIPAPTVNQSVEVPFRLEGIVSDEQALTLTLNGQVVPLLPTNTSNAYSFSLSYNLPLNEQQRLTLKATDFAGNSTTKEYLVINRANVSADIIAPRSGKQFLVDTDQFNLQLVASINNIEQAPVLKVQIGSGAKQDVVAVNNLINTTLSMPARTGEHNVTLYAYDQSGDLKAKSSRQFSIQKMEDIPQAIIKTQPRSLENNVEPNAFLSFYFNKAIDSSKLSIKVTETIHGKTYIDDTQAGASILEARSEKLIQVDRDHQIMPGSVASLPGQHSFAFYPERDFGYGASVKAVISLGEEEIHRFSFNVRPLPTLIDGHIKDNFYTSIPNIKVRLHEINRNEVTNSDSSFSFGYLEGGEYNIAGGRYTLELNPNRENPLFGNYIRHINVKQGERNKLPTMILSMINKTVPFSTIQSGQGETTHANGDLTLDLTQAQLRFFNGEQSGNMQFSMQDITQIGMKVPDSAPALWVLSGQPQGVSVSGNVELSIKAASLLGSYQYLPDDNQYLALVGRGSESNELDVVGVAQRQGYWIRSQGKVQLENLDYLGFARVHYEKQAVLEEYANGNIELMQLKAELNP